MGKSQVGQREIGIAIVGSGRIGSLRARLVAQHPSVTYLAVSDLDPARAEQLKHEVGASFSSGDTLEMIGRPEVTAVIVSTGEAQHTGPVLQALELGKSVLVEKPLALSLADADAVLAALERSDGELHVGYSRRFKHRYLRAKEQLIQGRLGTITGVTGRVYSGRRDAFGLLQRDPHATPVVDVLTYYVDLVNWLLEGARPVEVVARGFRGNGVFRQAGYDVDDVTWAILTYDNGAVVNLGISYALPANYPSLGQAGRVEVLGTDGVLLLDDDHTDQLMYTEHGFPHVYVPGLTVNMAFLGSSTPGDWALGGFWGPIATETQVWLDHLATGQGCALTTAREARLTLETTLAMERAARTGETVRLPLDA
ncbi:MAG: Gfo/Idh/MocA family oxidoreductase [Chloroflexi bacterium]|nr:Gfo/Idh/MocA family oxidoreductase [Chloroflexota bacterium]